MVHSHCNELTQAQQDHLLNVARHSIEQGLHSHHPLSLNEIGRVDDELNEEGCCFVTLHHNKKLRGCIGSLTPYQPLIQDVAEHAYAAAYRDPRFSPVSEQELAELDIDISILLPAELVQVENEKDLLSQLQTGRDGLIIEDPLCSNFSPAKATFLPSVWEQLPDAKEFVAALKQKAGLPRDYWSDSICFKRYQTLSFSALHKETSH